MDPNDQNNAPVSNDDGNSLDDILALEPKEVPKVDLSKVKADGNGIGETTKKESKRIRWICRNCSYQYEGYEKLDACPRCGKDPSFFEDVE